MPKELKLTAISDPTYPKSRKEDIKEFKGKKKKKAKEKQRDSESREFRHSGSSVKKKGKIIFLVL